MHMADALVAPTVAGTMYACSAVATIYAVKHIELENDQKKIPTMGVMGAFVFAAQMINFTIPGTGSSGHICGGVILAAILGPQAAFLTMAGVLLVQCLMFADGGLLAYGCNLWNMAAYGCFIGGGLLWKRFMRGGVSPRKITIASVVASVVSLQLGAFSVTVETLLSGVTELPFRIFVGVMQPIHLAIGLVEGLISAAVLSFVYETRPELIWTGNEDKGLTKKKARLSYRGILGVMAGITVAVAGGLSLFASSHPDGLEWSIKRLTGSTSVHASGVAYTIAQKIQSVTARFPDYGFAHGETAFGTSVSGLLGGALVITLCVVLCYVIRWFNHRERV